MPTALASRTPVTAPRADGLRTARRPVSEAPGSDATGLRLSELFGALSHALDLTEGQPPGHSVRAAWIGDCIGSALGLDAAARRDLFHSVLLKDLGCSSTAARICELFVADDLDFKREMRMVDFESPLQALPFFLHQAGGSGGLAARWRGWRNLATRGRGLGTELVATRCHRGAEIARLLRFPEAVADAIHALDERWDGKGMPSAFAGDRIPLYARIASVAQAMEVFAAIRGAEPAMEMLRERRGRWFDPVIADVALSLGSVVSFWKRLSSPDLPDEVYAMPHAGGEMLVDEDYLDDITEAFGRIVDAKSPFTSGHSARVGHVAWTIARRLGLDDAHARWLRRGALLHDIGKLGVSNAILDKPGKLDAAEWETMRRHAAWTEDVLGRITAFRVLSRVAGAHHERLDGNGYPRGLDARHLRIETRIITVADIFDALTADRPYRAAMPVARALALIEGDVGTALDGACVEALKAALDAGELRVAPGA